MHCDWHGVSILGVSSTTIDRTDTRQLKAVRPQQLLPMLQNYGPDMSLSMQHCIGVTYLCKTRTNSSELPILSKQPSDPTPA